MTTPEIIFGAIALMAAIGAWLGGRTDRTKDIVDATDTMKNWMQERLNAAYAEIDNLKKCLRCHGIDPDDCNQTKGGT